MIFSFILWLCFASSVISNAVTNEQPNGLSNESNEPPGVSFRKNHDINLNNVQHDADSNNQEDAKMFNEKMKLMISKMSLEEKIGALQVNNEWYARAQKVETDFKGTLRIWRDVIAKYCCSSDIRYVIEMYPTRYHSSPEAAKRRQNEIHNKIRKLLDGRKERTDARIKELINIINILKAENGNADVKTAWEKLKKINYGLPKVISNPSTESSYSPWTITADKSNTSTLGMNLVKLYEASNIEDAKKVYNERKSFWCSKEIQTINETEISIFLCSIPFEIVASKCTDNDKWLTDTDEINYALDIVKTGQISNPSRSKYYDSCLWIMYTINHDDIVEIRQKINKRWPSKDRANQYHLYCHEYAQLYNMVSVVSAHGRIQPPPQCEPTAQDYQLYMNFLYKKNANFCFVAKTLLYPAPSLQEWEKC